METGAITPSNAAIETCYYKSLKSILKKEQQIKAKHQNSNENWKPALKIAKSEMFSLNSH